MLVGEVGVALGGACVGMTEQASDGVEIEPAHHGVTCEGVPAVMDADIVKPCKTAKLADPSEDHSLSSTLSPWSCARDRVETPRARPRPTNTSGDATLGGTDGFIELPRGADIFPDGTPARLFRW